MLGLLDAEQFATTDVVQYVRELGARHRAGRPGRGVGSVPAARADASTRCAPSPTAGAVMPQKSTYFFPKLFGGFLFNPLDA